MTNGTALLEARQVSKGFFGNPVLKGVSIALEPGRIHALLGENGAGKSTLINLLSGALQPDGGEILIEGRPVSRYNPGAARAAGIAVVQQELSLASELSIAENIGLGAYPKKFGFIDYRTLQARVADVCARVGLTEPPDMPVGDLALGRRQMVEIAKALFRNPRVLILDEPTSSLSAHEAGVLSRLVRNLSQQGSALLYISHRLNEVEALCSHVTVLKDGVVTADQPLAGVGGAGLVRLMVGREAGDLFPAWCPADEGDELIALADFSAGMAKDVDFSGRAGEIVGIGGLVGQGQEDFLLGLYGAIPATAAQARIGRETGPLRQVGAANAAGLAYVPADRKKEGLVLPHSIAANLLLPTFGRAAGHGMRDAAAERGIVAELAARLTIKGDTARAVQALSGGNQQKVALAKWLPLHPSILLLNDPTRGVDIETKREIYLMLRSFATEGKLIVLLSSDTPELVHLCDRVTVFREGRAVATLSRDRLSEEAIVGAAMGIAPEGAAA
ncbi:sugar ABC transporter ATP-binding protein [Rhizobium sp. TRM95111]|uniref:sugar ABC transporter ATP-binding protein n=1 Tax=Rhizobium alarense TaxID=2846851 RepID=UPI001F20F2A1|nr:sugar ABC transporter ATP-binding protein [Rhizobium alarense]MCF3640399.1 sugar ABC transporter ATP-binding protein [Rhizobium alarense]